MEKKKEEQDRVRNVLKNGGSIVSRNKTEIHVRICKETHFEKVIKLIEILSIASLDSIEEFCSYFYNEINKYRESCSSPTNSTSRCSRKIERASRCTGLLAIAIGDLLVNSESDSEPRKTAHTASRDPEFCEVFAKTIYTQLYDLLIHNIMKLTKDDQKRYKELHFITLTACHENTVDSLRIIYEKLEEINKLLFNRKSLKGSTKENDV